MSGGGGDSNAETDNTIRFAPYLELFHSDCMNDQGADFCTISVADALNDAFGNSPFGSMPTLNPEVGLFGTGYQLSDFPSLYDMFGKFMAGLDLHTLWDQTHHGYLNSGSINRAVTEHATKLDNDIEQNVLPRFESGMRDIGAIHSSAFAIGKAIIEDSRVRAQGEFVGKLELHILELTSKAWSEHLAWNKSVVTMHGALLETQQSLIIEAESWEAQMAAKDQTFDLDLFEYARSWIGAMSGSPSTAGPGDKMAGPSQGQKALSGALAGAAAGGSYGGWWGAAAGGIIGGLAGYFS